MIHQYQLQVSREELDFRFCVLSGQVFRWREVEPEVFVGVDGGNAYRVVRNGALLTVESNAPAEAFDRFLRLDENAAQAAARIRERAPEMATFMSALQGLRILRPSSRVEVFLGFLCSANNTLHRIMPMVRALSDYGDEIEPGPWGRQRAFPALDRIASLDPDTLRQKGFGYRAPTIVLAAQHALDQGGGAWLESLSQLEYLEARSHLCEIRGLGRKLADCICLFGLGHTEAVPIDTHVWTAVCRTYFPDWAGKAITEARYEAVGACMREKLGKDAGWAQQFLYSAGVAAKRKDLRAPDV